MNLADLRLARVARVAHHDLALRVEDHQPEVAPGQAEGGRDLAAVVDIDRPLHLVAHGTHELTLDLPFHHGRAPGRISDREPDRVRGHLPAVQRPAQGLALTTAQALSTLDHDEHTLTLEVAQAHRIDGSLTHEHEVGDRDLFVDGLENLGDIVDLGPHGPPGRADPQENHEHGAPQDPQLAVALHGAEYSGTLETCSNGARGRTSRSITPSHASSRSR